MSEEKTVKAVIYNNLKAKHLATYHENGELKTIIIQLESTIAAMRDEIKELTKAKESSDKSYTYSQQALNEKSTEIEELQVFCDMLPDAAPRRQPDTYRDNRVTMRLLAYFAAKASKP